MKKSILSIILAFATITICTAQKVEIKEVFGGYVFSQNGENKTMGNLIDVMESNPEAQSYMKKASSNNTLALVLGGVGGFCIGYPLGAVMGGRRSKSYSFRHWGRVSCC